VRRAATSLAGKLWQGSKSFVGGEGSSYFWARASDNNGNSVESWIETTESYRFTAAAAVRCVEKTLAGDLTGALTPAQAFGSDFVLEIDGSKRFDRLPS
jgi:short subunit dehydrogenase-like uncharacterized protein